MDGSQNEYYDAINGLDEFGPLLCGLIKELLADADIQIHSISYRVKNFDSTSRKLNLKSEKYDSASDLTDLLGIRVITYFSQDVDNVAEVIKNEFTIDKRNSIDKRKILDTDQFGYLSLHYVAEMLPKRARLTEYKRYTGTGFELQIRSILQHAWAEIEHDLGYKAKSGLPDPLKRRFSRLAGLLELADEEFVRLRGEISEYETAVNVTIKHSPQNLPIDQSTLISSFENEPYLNQLDELVSNVRGSSLKKDIDPLYIVNEGENLKILGINNIEKLHDYAKAYKNHIKKFAELWLTRSQSTSSNLLPSSRGIGLFYLNYALAAERDEDELSKWGLNISTRHKGLIDSIKSTWAEVVNELGKPEI